MNIKRWLTSVMIVGIVTAITGVRWLRNGEHGMGFRSCIILNKESFQCP
jgi:hypothetical protein